MLIGLAEALAWADRRSSALAAVNTPFFEALLATIDVGEKTGVPIILQFAQVHEPLVSINEIGPAMVALARRSDAPFVLHVDHGEDIDYIRNGLDIGFNSAMFDGSHLDFATNVARTREVVELASERGCGVEGEIGVMTGNENGDPSQGGADASLYTDPEVARRFVRQTGVTCLAASFGTVHGMYNAVPELNYELLDRLTATTGVPIVMHGGSGLDADEYRASIAHGVRKINYYTYAAKAALDAARPVANDPDNILFPKVAMAARQGVARDVEAFVTTLAGV
ncbi:MAG TPA: class II fructose-bisphosphate aldolase [Propionibacteriaceae bacterium]|nr:class II fructose-bisphosphate aldolase [Propionibacteriaceae bacterium]